MTVVLVVIVIASLLSAEADAREGFFKRRRAARQQTSYAPVQQQCTIGGDCGPGAGNLTINHNGGFEGQLTDQQFANYFASKSGIQQAAVSPPPIPLAIASIPKERSIIVTSNPVASLSDIDTAIQALDAAKESLAAAEDLVNRAIHADKKRSALAAIELEAKIKIMEVNYAEELKDLKAEQSALQLRGGGTATL